MPKYYVNHTLTDPGLEAAFSAPETRRGWAENAVRERLARPERAGAFQIAWMDDTGRARVNMGYFAAYPSLPGRSRCIFRGGLTQDEIARRALRLMLTGALCGGGAWMVCGADVDAHTLSNAESMRFCRAFADELGELPADDAIFDALPARERGYLSGLFRRRERSLSAPKAEGLGLCHFADEALRRRYGMGLCGRTVAVTGHGVEALSAAEAAIRMGAELVRRGADVWLLCDDETPLSPSRARAILDEAPDGIFEGVCLSCEPEAETLLAGADILFAPGIAAGSAAVLTSDAAEWEAEGLLRRGMRRVLDDVGVNVYAGAYRLAAARAAEHLIRRGIL